MTERSADERSGLRGIRPNRVSEWLESHVAGAQPPFRFELLAGGHSNLTYRVTDATGHAMVLRRPPLGQVLATAHDMAREFRVISGVAGKMCSWPSRSPIRRGVRRVRLNCVEGFVLDTPEAARSAFPESSLRRTLGESAVDALVALHAADPDSIGLGDLGPRESYLERQLERWRKQWERTKTRDRPEMEEAHARLCRHIPEQADTGIVHGDFRIGNLIAAPKGSVAAVLDWELCALGDPLADLGYLVYTWAEPGEAIDGDGSGQPTAAEGFPSRDEVVARYAERTGRDVSRIGYYRAFQAWRIAAIVEGVLSRYLKGALGDAPAETRRFAAQVERQIAVIDLERERADGGLVDAAAGL